MNTNIPTAGEAIGYAELITNYPVLIAAMFVGIFIGGVLILAAQRIGWLPNGKAGEIAKLQTDVEHLTATVDKLLAELKPWRKFQERLVENQLSDQLNKDRNE